METGVAFLDMGVPSSTINNPDEKQDVFACLVLVLTLNTDLCSDTAGLQGFLRVTSLIVDK